MRERCWKASSRVARETRRAPSASGSVAETASSRPLRATRASPFAMATRWPMASGDSSARRSPRPRSASVSARSTMSAKLVVLELPQGEDAGAGEQRRDDLERGVLRRRPDEDDRAVLDVGEDDVLLGLVEAVDLVDEEDGALGVHGAPLPGGLGDAAEVGDAGGDGGDGLEVGAGEAGDEVRQGWSCRSPAGPTAAARVSGPTRWRGGGRAPARRRGPARRTRRRSAGACGRPGAPPARCGHATRGRRGSWAWGLLWSWAGEHDGA